MTPGRFQTARGPIIDARRHSWYQCPMYATESGRGEREASSSTTCAYALLWQKYRLWDGLPSLFPIAVKGGATDSLQWL